ncbi:Sucrose/H+ symporter, plant [Penicillium digitatum]|uniref:Sucrose/H+ symporter, plant n=1 Tax=Penicillium digitatum TaxID=36651 RepID=A0A7T6XII2_PENDI|nr:Sucrose/H+ symporter, plant [Penicillium digitatum]
MCLGFVQTFAGFVAVRALLGVGGVYSLACPFIYLHSRDEVLPFRVHLKLLARGLEIGPRGRIEGWRWILIIEGLLTFVCEVLSFFFLPNILESASFLTTEEKELEGNRLILDSLGLLGGSLTPEAESFKWSEVRRGMLDPQVWLSASAYFAILPGLYCFDLFLPANIKNRGLAKDANEVYRVSDVV